MRRKELREAAKKVFFSGLAAIYDILKVPFATKNKSLRGGKALVAMPIKKELFRGFPKGLANKEKIYIAGSAYVGPIGLHPTFIADYTYTLTNTYIYILVN